MSRIELQIDLPGSNQASDEESGHDEQRKRSGDLSNDEKTTESLAWCAVRLALAAIVKRGTCIGLRGPPCRPDTNHRAGRDSGGKRIQKHMPVERHVEGE